ncbi:hypothetical protein [Halioxenophilus aromaticivorans]|uniref:SRPBCC family protein n=1 Tax=Halioxenophilus aromaticivorans TaxID=1306992 RepID=A0AAV3U908_9ALTE
MLILRVALWLLLITATAANSEVIHKAEHGFNLVITGSTDASPEQTYQQFLKVQDWWIASHTRFGKAENLSIDARAGGCFCEIQGQKQVQHMVVAMVNPGQEVQLLRGLGPLQMMDLHGAMSWRFEPLANGGTQITQSYNVSGFYPDGLQSLAGVVDSVQSAQLNALIAKLQSANP